MSFAEAKEEIERYLDINISESLIIKIAENIGNKINQKDIEEAETIYENYEQYIPDVKESNKENCTLNVLADGSMVSITEQKGACWKEMKLGMVYKDNNTIKMINGKHIITEKDYVAYLGSPEKFKQLLLKNAIDNGYGTTSDVVFIADGARWLWNICDELFPDAVQILDYYHLSENFYKYAKQLYPSDEEQRKKWVNAALKDIKEGRIDNVIERIPELDIKPDKNIDVPNLKGYLLNNKDRINYQEYKKKGYCIGSGAIESGNKKVIQQRLKQSGMHWSRQGGQSIASLRTKYCSSNWDKVEEFIYNAA